MLKKINLKNLKQILKEVVVRFPVAVFAILITFVLIGYQILVDTPYFIEDTLFKIIVSTIAVFFLSSATVLISPLFKGNTLKGGGVILQIITIIFGFLFYYFFDNSNVNNSFFSEEIIYIFLIFIGIISFLFFTAFIGKRYEQNSYYNYFIKTTAIFGMSFILGGALTALGFIGLGTIFTLFDLNSIINQGNFFSFFANFSLIIFTPLFFLSQLSKSINNKESLDLDNFSKFLVKYIAIPFIYIYFIILYAYTLKVLLNFNEWPQGEVTWMVVGFSLFGYLIYIFSYGLEQTNKSINTFRKFFPYVVLPQVGMLFYAIYLRINQYDITINRCFVVIFGIFLTVISLYYIFSKYKKIMILPVVLFCFIISISVGPWSVFNLPESRQINLLEEALTKAQIKQDGKIMIVEQKSDIDAKLSGTIYDLIGYLVNNHGGKSLEKVFPKLIEDIKIEDKKEWEKNQETPILNSFPLQEKEAAEYRGINSWTLIDKLRNKLKVEYYYEEKNDSINKFLYYGMEYKGFFPLNVIGYNYIGKIYSKDYKSNILLKEGVLYFKIDSTNKKGYLYNGSDLLEKVDLKNIIESIYKYKEGYNNKNTKEEMTFEIYGEKYNLKLFIQSISLINKNYINNDKKNIIDYGYDTHGYILIHKK